MSIVSIRDINIAYEDTGQGTPLVLIHGHPFNRSMWSDQVCALSTNYRVIAPDLQRLRGNNRCTGEDHIGRFCSGRRTAARQSEH